MKTKAQILEENGWQKLVGYCFDVAPCDNDCETFVDKEEVDAKIARGVQTYWHQEESWDEYIRDEDDAFENVMEQIIENLEDEKLQDEVANMNEKQFIEWYSGWKKQ
jgi:hypothetical protein